MHHPAPRIDSYPAERECDRAGNRVRDKRRLIDLLRPVGFRGMDSQRGLAIFDGWIERHIVYRGVELIDGAPQPRWIDSTLAGEVFDCEGLETRIAVHDVLLRAQQRRGLGIVNLK